MDRWDAKIELEKKNGGSIRDKKGVFYRMQRDKKGHFFLKMGIFTKLSGNLFYIFF